MSNNRWSITFPSKGRLVFDGGLNSKFERSVIQDNESPDCANVVFSNGSVATRPGTTKFNTTAVGSFAFDGLYTRRVDTGAETMIAFAGGSGWHLSGASTFSTIASAQSVFTAGVRVATTQYENHMFIGNGYVIPYKYNGTDFTRHGVYPPTTTMTAASQSTGALSGVYSYKVTFVNSQSVEGDGGPANTFTVAAGMVRLTSVPTAAQSWGVASRRIYRTDDNGSTYKRIATLSDNSTTTYDDNIASSAAGATMPSDNGVPPLYSTIVYHQNRLFCNDQANPNYVWYSNLGEPYTYAQATNFIKIGDATSDIVKGLYVYGNNILVMCEKSMHIIYMPDTTPANWSPIRLTTQYGSKSPFSPFIYNNRCMFAAMDNDKFVGFAAISGTQIDPDATILEAAAAGSDMKSERIEPEMFDVQEEYVGNISAMVYKNKAYITVTHDTGNTANNRVYIFDFSISNLAKKQKAAWVPVSGLSAAQFTMYDGALYYGSSAANGFVFKLDESGVYADNSTAIDSYFWTKEFSGMPGHENLTKDFRTIQLLVDKAGAYYMNVRYRTDSDSGVGQVKQIDLTPGSMLWGSGIWGSSEWGGGKAQQEFTITLGQVRGKRIQLRFDNQNTAGQRFKVHGANITYNLKGKR